MIDTPKKKGIRVELVELWRRNVRIIFDVMHFTQTDLADKMGRTRTSISTMMTREDLHMTAIQFLGSLRGLEEMIWESDADELSKALALSYLDEIDKDYLEKGLH